MAHTFAQNFSCMAGSPVRVQFTGCSSTPTWADNGTSAAILRTISSAGTYTVNCGGTLNSFRITNVNACPSLTCSLSLNASVNPVTAGQSSVLTYSGCDGGTVSWDRGLGTGDNKTVSPTATTTYNATCTPANGLICTKSVTVNFVDCAVAANSNPTAIVAGQSSTLSFTGCSGGSVDWVTDNDEGVGSGNNVVVSPTTTTNYIAVCHKGGSYCLGSVTVSVTNCTITASASPNNLNAGQSSTLSFTGCVSGSVSWDNGAGSGNNVTVTPFTTTTYTGTCTPTGGGSTCAALVTVTVIPCSISAFSSSPGINVGQSAILSYTGCSNGSVTWNNGIGSGNNRTVMPVFTTTYTAICTPFGGGNDCSTEVTVAVSPAPIFINSTSSKAPSCTDGKNGSIFIGLSRRIVTGETNIRLTLLKNNSLVGTYLGQAAAFVTPENLDAGTYQIVIETLIGSVVSARAESSVTLSNPLPVVFSLSKTDIKCFGGADGTLQIEASGGTGSFLCQINDGDLSAFNGGMKHNLTNVGLGTFRIRVSDSFNCTALPQNISVNQPNEKVELTKISQKDPRGFETKDGQGVVRVKGGTPSYVFEWVDEKGVSYGSGETILPENANKFLRGGTYFARVYDANYAMATQKAGCFSEVAFTLVEPPIIEARIDLSNEVSCFGKKDGVLLVTPKGGVSSAAGEYKMQLLSQANASSVFLSNKALFEKLPAGQYTLTVTDANDVSRSFNYTITEPSKVLARVIALTQLTCFGDKTGSIEIGASGGKNGYVAIWNTNSKAMKISGLSAGRYTAVVTDASGCQSDIVAAEIKGPPKLDIAFRISQPTCSYSCNGSVTAGVTGGTGAYQMSWEGRNDKDTRLENLCGNELLLFKVTDANQCVATKTAVLLRPAAIASKVESEKKLCEGQSIRLDATNELADSYLWKLPDGTTSTQPILDTKLAGIYSLSLFDNAKCEFKSTVNVAQVATNGRIRFASASIAPRDETVVVLNLSDTTPTQVDWLLPKEALVKIKTNERVEFSIGTLGNYIVGVKATFAACEMYQSKPLSIVDFYPKTVAVNNDDVVLKVSPNPSFDDLEVNLRFAQPTSFKLRLFEAGNPNRVVFEMEEKDKADFITKISALLLNSGQYILTVDSPTGRVTQKVTVLK